MRTFYSSSGDIMAPGGSAIFGGSDEDILSTWNDGKYQTLAGTSQAAPHVAGVAALLVSLGVHGQAVVNRILSTATDAGLAGPDDVYGYGIVNARAAVAGLGGSSGGNGGGTTGGGGGPKGGFSYKQTQKIKNVLKHGVKMTCRPAAAGKCKTHVRARGKLIASGSRSVGGPGKVTVSAKVTTAGRKMLKKAKRVNATLIADVPGAGRASGSLKLVR
jgi:hypothetical protein